MTGHASHSTHELSAKDTNVRATVANPYGIFIDDKLFAAHKGEADSAREKQSTAKTLRLAKAADKKEET